MISRLNLYDSNRNKINLEAIGLFGYKITIPSPSYSLQTVQLDSGQTIPINKTKNTREIIADFLTNATNYNETLEQKSLLFALLGNGKEFFVEQTHRPGILWKVHLGNWTPEHIGAHTTLFSIPLTCISGVSETINVIEKKFTESTFTFVNEGSVEIDPRKHTEAEITFRGESTNLSITNKTTGETWSYNGTTTAEDIITLKGVRALKSDLSIFKDTNKKVITFAPGNNEIEISGATGEIELTISTRFYFL